MSVLRNKVTQALQNIDAFSALLQQEASALQKSDYTTFQNLQGAKLEMAHAYQDAVLSFEEQGDQLQNMEAGDKKMLQECYARFREACKLNEAALLASRTVAERVVNLVMKAARQTVMDGPAYCAMGRQGISDKVPVHFKLNEVL